MTKKEKVARAVGNILEEHDWSVFSIQEKCPACSEKCDSFISPTYKYCPFCAELLERRVEKDVIEILYKAFQAGLKVYNNK